MQTDPPPSTGPEPLPLNCRVLLAYSGRVNFAMQQSGSPLVDSVTLVSNDYRPLEDLTIELGLDNGEAQPWVGRVARLDPGEEVSLRPDTLRLSAKAFASRTEAERSDYVATLTCSAGTLSKRFPVDLLAFDQWPGVGYFAEQTAAFVTPNHPKVAELLGVARQAMGGLSDSDALDGYQSKSRQRASLLAEACFNAAAAQGIGYINPPASFELTGQRVRLVDRVLREQLGTCLDLSLLLMGMWEQCGLHPLVLLPEGHAMPAVWTHDAHLAEAVIDEPARIRNLVELGEVIPVESTHLTEPGAAYAGAVESAKKKLRSPGERFLAVDIRSARKRGVRPLPLRVDGGPGVDLDALSQEQSRAADTTLDSVALADRAEAWSPGTTADEEDAPARIQRWQKRLLDLSLRNRLLNFKQTGRTLPLAVPDPAALEDTLAGGGSFTVLPKSEAGEDFLRQELDDHRLYTLEPAAETQKRLLNLYRLAKSSIEETGANILYLSLGLLKWYEHDTADQPRFAPLILLPVRLVRASGGEGYRYTLSLSEEPLYPNVTLLEKLRVDFGIETDGLDGLPEDEHGLDTDLILRNFRSAIRSMPKWEVVDSASIGLFSFNKFLMWKDLQEKTDRLKENRLVGHLVDRPGETFDDRPFPDAAELDDETAPGGLLCTRDADSSQLCAIRAAADRRSFVLEGPPGTGKSQTIANVIADALGRGRRVLFVAEKMAALSVVRRRLEDDGLGAFCLELHSAKASKKEVLRQIEESLNAARPTTPTHWDTLCKDLGTTRDQLNAYIRAMHEPRGTDESLYQMIGRLNLLGDGPSVPPPTDAPAETTAEGLDAWLRAIAELGQRARPIDPAGAFPLRGIGQAGWSFSLPQQAKDAIDAAKPANTAHRDAVGALLRDAGVDADAGRLGRDAVGALREAAAMLIDCPTPARALVHGADAPGLRQRLREALPVGRERDAKRAGLLKTYREEVLGIDPLVHLDAVRRHIKRPLVFRWFTAGGVKKPLRIYAKDKLPPLPDVVNDLETIRGVKKLQAELDTYTDLAQALGPSWRGSEAGWDDLERDVVWGERFAELLSALNADNALPGVAEALADIAADESRHRALAGVTQALVDAAEQWEQAWEKTAQVLATDLELAFGGGEAGWLSAIADTLGRWAGNLGELNTWCSWRQARDAAAGLGLEPLIALYEQGGCAVDEIEAVFWRSFGGPWFTAVADGVDAVRSFNASAHDDAIERFRLLDSRSIELSRYVISAGLSAGMPSGSADASDKSEMGILRREISKKRRHLPTRRLIESIPTLLPRLKPCFLMSPLSVAQFLEAQLPPFDLVVFDEASQIPVWDAIGAIARGSEVIVVGDSKQLPPTMFFNTLEDEDDETDINDHAVDDMESILKECNASGIPAMRLKWHYRSRHESLITFSNHHYYQNQLHTFPSPVERSDDLGVTFRHVENGVYDRGGTRTNRVEAERVVGTVVDMLRDPGNTDSIGVVTFSQAQQSLVEDLLDEKRRAFPEIERFLTGEADEPVFIKNLENVQGDERDAIIFSVGYGPDEDGRVSMNFGPLNKEGGERRLNVAVTRARRRLIVFSSITSDQVDLNRTSATGVRDFKTFLDFAKRGPSAIPDAASLIDEKDFDKGFERVVWQALTDAGWAVDTRVGCAGYRIDLAVKHPDHPGRYVVGIECDGAAYHSAKTARDRDRIREAVLEGLGWRIERAWSTQWHVNPRGCLQALIASIESAVASANEVGLPDQAEHPAPPAEEDDAPPGDWLYAEVEHDGPQPNPLPIYTPASFARFKLDEVDIHSASAEAKLDKVLLKIVEAEAPVTDNLAMQRFADAFGVGRATQRFRDRYDAIRDQAVNERLITASHSVLWRRDQDPGAYDTFRVAGEDEASVRDVEDIPLVEVINAAVYVLRQQFGLPREDLVREIGKLFGITRATSRVAERIDEAVQVLLDTARAVDTGGRITAAEQQG